MAINPPSDIVLDVARAADPARFQAASKRLSDLSSAPGASEFADVFKGTIARSSVRMPEDPYSIKTAFRNETVRSEAEKTASALQQFEAFILQSFVESMLPKDAGAVFGKESAGGIWKSMLAEQIGAQLAKAGGIGIASKVLAKHPSLVQTGGQRTEGAPRDAGVALHADA